MSRGAFVVALGVVVASAGASSAKDPRDPDVILATLDRLVRPTAATWCKAKGISFPPEVMLLRIFKREREVEIWAKNRGHATMQLLHRSPLCAMDFAPGPKLSRGDSKTPEGFYHSDFLYPSPYWWMWIDLDDVDAPGQVGKGSAFRMCIDYPNPLDAARTRAARAADAGGGICIHGNCVSIGCASFENRDYLPVFDLARHHDERAFGKVQVHIFPFRFDQVSETERVMLADAYVHHDAVGRDVLLRLWRNLEEGYAEFNANPNPLGFAAGPAGTYVFRPSPAEKRP